MLYSIMIFVVKTGKFLDQNFYKNSLIILIIEVFFLTLVTLKVYFMKKLLILIISLGFILSSCGGWAGKFHNENWGHPKPKKAKKGHNHSWM